MPDWLRSTCLTKMVRLGIRPHSAVSNPSTGMKVTDGNMCIDMFVREGGTDREVEGDVFICSREITRPHRSQVVTAYMTRDQSQKMKHLCGASLQSAHNNPSCQVTKAFKPAYF